MKVTLVRHGTTEYNYLGKMQGLRNEMLNDEGRRQCQKLRDKISDKHYDCCYMSPLIRAVETAIILIGDRVPTIPDDRLVERYLGDLEGKDFSCYDYDKYWDYDLNCCDDGVEGIKSIFDRCRDFLNYVKSANKDQSILIVSHAAVIRCLHYLLTNADLSKKLEYLKVGNCFIEEIDVK